MLESEKKYQALFELAPVGIAIVDSERNIIEANITLEKIAGISKEGLKNGLYKKRKYINSDGREMLPEEFPSSIALRERKTVNNIEIGIVDENGKIFWTEVSAAPLDNDGSFAILITQDINDRKILQKQLNESEAKLRALYENSIDAFLLTGPDGSIYNANPAACKMFDRTEGEIINIGREGVVDVTDPRLYILLAERAAKGKARGELTMIRKDGTRFPAELSSSLFVDTEERIRTSMIIRDITERKKAEDERSRLVLMLDTAPSSITIHDFEGRFLYANQRTFDMHGFTRDEFLALNLHQLDVPESEKMIAQRMQELLDRNELIFQAAHYKRDGSILPLEISTQITTWGDKKVILSIATDITVRKQVEEEIRKSKKLLEDLNKHLIEIRENEMSQIAMNLHDDLGQKLTALNLNIAWLKSRIRVQSQAVRKKLEDMSLMISETIESIKEISSFLRPWILFELGLVPAFEWQLKKFEQDSGIQCHFYYESEEFKIDNHIALMLYRILQESLTNIARHSEASVAEVTIRLIQNKIELLIKDNGIGIDEDKINSLTSLGIAGIKERARSLGGSVLIKGEKGSWTFLKVSVPLKNQDEP